VANFQSSLLTPQPQRWPALHPSFVAQIFRVAFWPVTCCHVSCYMSYWIPLACTDLMQNVLHS
jgi:hypothetical protein